MDRHFHHCLKDNKTDLHDMGYFDTYPAAMYQAMCALSPSHAINHTTPYYGPLLYTLGRIIGVHKVLEIGVAYGWTGGFLAHAVKENNVRYQMNGKYYGLDIEDKSWLSPKFEKFGLPHEFILAEKGSVDWLRTQTTFGPETLDMVFVDGWHNNNYVLNEFELLYPLVKGGGNGYIVMHDVYAFVEAAYKKIIQNPRYKLEYVRFLPNYGFAILRKIEGEDPDKIHWPDGDQKEEDGFIT